MKALTCGIHPIHDFNDTITYIGLAVYIGSAVFYWL